MLDKVNILMVDDQPSKLLTYEAILSDLGENLIRAQSAREALDHVLKTQFAVVLLDVNMPELDGFQLADMLRKHPRFQDLAIIFISATHLTDRDRLKGYEHGAVDYITVPIIPELLRAKVQVFASLYRKTRQLEAVNVEMQRLSVQMMALQDDERRRIAREMHDGLGQELSAAKMTIKSIRTADAREKVDAACDFIDNAITQVRSITFLLHPPLLDLSGLGSAIRSLVEGLAERSGFKISLDIRPTEFPRFSIELETAIYRIVQEALTNVFRHSGGRNASVSLFVEHGRLVGRVRDDGKGVPEHIVKFRPGGAGVGLAGMTQRCKELAGEFRIQNVNPGTLVEIVIPVSAVLDKAVAAADSDGRSMVK